MEDSTREAAMVVHAFRLMRSGNYQRLSLLEKAIREDFPDASDEEIRACKAKLREIVARMS